MFHLIKQEFYLFFMLFFVLKVNYLQILYNNAQKLEEHKEGFCQIKLAFMELGRITSKTSI